MTDFVFEAKELLKTWEFCSVGLLQRKLRTGYVTAARVVEKLRDQGVIGSEWDVEGHGYPVLIGRQANTSVEPTIDGNSEPTYHPIRMDGKKS